LEYEPEDWFRRGRRSFGGRGDDIFGQFDEMRREVERIFEHQFKDLETKAPKDLVREYETPEGGKVREMGAVCLWIFNDNRPRWQATGKRIW
jgi:HSP20 family protein